jgi:hypothetical protein
MASFDLSGSVLKVILSNTSKSDVLVPADVLTGLFFNTTHTLTPVSASLNGSAVFYKAFTDPGNGWGYGSGLDAHGLNSAISSSGAVKGLGLSSFSRETDALQGLDYGILSLGDDPKTGNNAILKKGPLFKNSIEFTFAAPDDFKLDELGPWVIFQYGTNINEPSVKGLAPTVPEPGTLFLLGSGLAGLILATKLRKRKG